MLRYKACRNSIVTLVLSEASKTNEKRDDVINDRYAKFRCNEAKVISITNVETGEMMENDISIHDASFEYRVGKIIATDFDEDLDEVYAEGIHYFKSKEAALSWFYIQNCKIPDGEWRMWHENGRKHSEGTYKNGERDGKWMFLYENGYKKLGGTFKDGEKDGEWIGWCRNGNKKSKGTYKNGLRDGKWIWWNISDEYVERTYIEGILQDKKFHIDGILQDKKFHISCVSLGGSGDFFPPITLNNLL